MSYSVRHEGIRAPARDRTRTLFAQTMGYVAVTAALFALGAYLGRNLTYGVGFAAFIAAFACLIGMRFAARKSTSLTVGLLAAFGLLIGVAVAPTLAYYASVNPQALWQAGGATALFIAGFGAAGYATRRDLSAIARVCFWALLALIVFGIVLIFVHIPHGALIYSVIGLVIFAGFTMFDFQRLRRSQDIASAPFLAASIFLDILNVFLFFLQIFSGSNRD
jgi:FtsH-binding integral membrane protein